MSAYTLSAHVPVLDMIRVGVLTLKSWAISRTKRWKGSLRMRSSVDFW
jgi:hypothetical protein